MVLARLSLLFFCSIFISGCFENMPENIKEYLTKDEERELITQGLSPKALFEKAKLQINEGASEEGLKLLEQLQAAYPASKYALQAKLDIIFTHYDREEYDSAIDKANDFIKLYPNDFTTPYAYYLRGISAEDKSRSILDNFITDNAQRDVSSAIDAFNYYMDLIKKFPKTEYSEEAKTRLIIIRNIIARHELFVAIYYTKKKAYLAAINRSNYIIEKFPGTPSVPAALSLLVHNYKQIDATDLENDAKRVLESSYPEYRPHYSLED